MNQECLSCESSEGQIKTGRNRCGTQRYLCRNCGKTYTLEAKQRGYAEEVREKAVRMYVEGNNFRRIGRLLSVNHQSVVNWVNAYHDKIKDKTAVPRNSKTIEMDELWTFVEEKKTKLIS
jgi:transposase-like protein